MFANPLGRDEQRYIMSSCQHNDVTGLTNRYLRETLNTFTADVKLIDAILDELATKLRPFYKERLTLAQFLSEKSGKLLCRYETAARKILKSGFHLEKHSEVQAFIKNELYGELKPPRMIMGRDPRFNLIYGQFTSALEHSMVHLPEISKGRNFKDRGDQFFEKIYGANIAEVDFSKYESTQRLEVLKLVELGLARRLMGDHDYQLFRQLFIAKMRKKGVTVNNTKFEFWYCRGSGDMDTGLFNTLLTWVACRYFEIINGTGNFNFICDGDDNLMRIPVGHGQLTDTFAHFGFEAKLKVVTDYHDAEYCSGKFIQYQPGKFYYVQDLRKLMENIRYFRKTQFSHCKGTYYHSLGYMYKVLYPNFPLYTNIANFLMRMSPGKHVSVEILREINPAHADAFKGSKHLELGGTLPLNVELGMCFNLSSLEISQLSDWYDAQTINLPPDEDKRYNSSKPPADRLSHHETCLVEQLLENATMRHVFSKQFSKRVISQL